MFRATAHLFLPQVHLWVHLIIFNVICLFGLSVIFFLFPYLSQNCFASFASRSRLVYPRAFYINLLVEFSVIFWECPVLFVLLQPASVYFVPPFFHLYLLIYFSQLYYQTYFMLSCFGRFITRYPSAFFLSLQFCVLPQFLYLCFLLNFPYMFLYFCLDSFGEYRFYNRLVLLLHTLASLVQWCCPLDIWR